MGFELPFAGLFSDVLAAISSMWKQEEKELVINRLTEGANEMFLWVFCQLDRLRCYLPRRIRRALDELPGSRLFQCITVAPLPLRVE